MWTARVVLPFVGLFVLLTTVVVIAMLRLSGVIAWPSRWVGLVPVAVLLNAAKATNEFPPP